MVKSLFILVICFSIFNCNCTVHFCRYVRLVEGDIHDSMTLHQSNEDGRYSRRVTSTKHHVRDIFIPPHLYGQLVQHEKGFQLLVKEGKLHNLFHVRTLHSPDASVMFITCLAGFIVHEVCWRGVVTIVFICLIGVNTQIPLWQVLQLYFFFTFLG